MLNYQNTEMLGPNNAAKMHGAYLERPFPTAYGEWVLVDYQHSSEEQHHQVVLVDENNAPVRNIFVMFGFPGGDGNDYGALKPDVNHWRGSPQVLRGNMVQTDGGGSAKHTTGAGGEDIWVWDIEEDSFGTTVLELPSVIVKNNLVLGTQQGGINEHTGARLTFQRRRVGIIPIVDVLNNLENRVAALENE